MANYPTKGPGGLSQGESPSLYDIDTIDDTLKADAEGGYEYRRRRSTAKARKTLETGYIGLPHNDYLLLSAFWDSHGKTVPFTYFDYMHGVYRQVRFDEFKPDYKGVGQHRRWDIKIKLSEMVPTTNPGAPEPDPDPVIGAPYTLDFSDPNNSVYIGVLI